MEKRKKNKTRGSQAGKVPPTGRPVGRPLTGMTPYDPSFIREAIVLGSQGKSECQIAINFGVTRSTMREWGKSHPEFGEALRISREASQAWWENKGNTSLEKKVFQTALYNKIVTSRFRNDYSEKVTVSGDPDAPLTAITRIERVIIKQKG